MTDAVSPICQPLIDCVDAALGASDTEALTARLRNGLCQLMRDQRLQLPAAILTPRGDRYARRELYRSTRHAYSIVAMTWGPGQGTSIHDHAGLWCVEGIWRGQLQITRYALRAHDAAGWRFDAETVFIAGTGSAGSLIPPHEYHTIRNPSSSAVAISLHVYAEPITCCGVYEPQAGAPGHYQRRERQLSLDPID